MTDDELHDLINGDAPAKALAEAGDDAGAAERASAIAEPVTSEYRLTSGGVLDFAGPIRGTEIMAALRSLPGMTEIVRLMDKDGVNIGHRDAAGMFTSLVAGDVLTAEEADGVAALAQGRPVITAADVSRVWDRYRPGGKVVANG